MNADERERASGVVADWIASGRRPYADVLRNLGELLVAIAEQDGTERTSPPQRARGDAVTVGGPARAAREGTMTETIERATREPFSAPPLPSAEPPATEDIAMMLADARARAHELIDQSVARAREMLERRQPDADEAATNAQREAQRLALERLRRSVAEIHSDIRALHARLDGIEGLLRQRREPEGAASGTAVARPATSDVSATSKAMGEPTRGASSAPSLPAKTGTPAPSATAAPAATTAAGASAASPAAAPAARSQSEPQPRSATTAPRVAGSLGTSERTAEAAAALDTTSSASGGETEAPTAAAASETSRSVSETDAPSTASVADAIASARAERAQRSEEERAALAAGARASLAAALDEAATAAAERATTAASERATTAATTASETSARSEATPAAASTAQAADETAASTDEPDSKAEPTRSSTPAEAVARATNAEAPSTEHAHRRIEDAVATALTAARNAAVAAARPSLPASRVGDVRETSTSSPTLDESTEAPPAPSTTTGSRLPATSGARNELQTESPGEAAAEAMRGARTDIGRPSNEERSVSAASSGVRADVPAATRPAGLWTPPTVAPPTPARPRAESPSPAVAKTDVGTESPGARSRDEMADRPVSASALRSSDTESGAATTPTPRPFTPVTPPTASTQAPERAAEVASQSVPRFATPVQQSTERAEVPSASRTSAPPASLRPNPPTVTAPRGATDEVPTAEARPDATPADAGRESAAEAQGATKVATSFPGGGAIVVRVSPISGFQGLMRVQDAIANLKEVREAAVEAYARGEAQLRVALTDELAPERLTAALAQGLGQDARVDSASVDERTMRVTLA